MGNQLLTDLAPTKLDQMDCATAINQGRATLQNIAGTWFVDDRKIVIARNRAAVYKRDGVQTWQFQESVEVKDEFLHFQFKNHILSKGRLRANSSELMFRHGEDVRIWTRQDPFLLGDLDRCLDFNHPDCDKSIGGDCLSLRHPSEMGANEGRKSCNGELALGPSDSYEERLPVPGDSAEDEFPDEVLPIVDPQAFSNSIMVLRASKIASSLQDWDSGDSDDFYSSSTCLSDFNSIEPSWVDDSFFSEV